MKRIVIAAGVAAGLAASAAPASAWDRGGIGPGGAAALGVLGGLAVGGAIASSNNGYYPGRPVYVAPPPRPVYVESECYVQRRRYVDEFGDVIVRRVRVCD